MVEPRMKKYYEKQIGVSAIGETGQEKLLASTIVIVGCGGLCAGVLPSVAGMGCRRLILIDGDKVEESNLHRQSIHGGKVGMLKAESAKLFALAQNGNLEVEAVSTFLTMDNAKSLLSGAALIFDCTDNLPTRRLISDAVCTATDCRTPVVSGSALKLSGQVLLYNIGEKDSYRTLLGSQGQMCSPDAAGQDCSSAGIFGPVPQLIGHLMAIEGAKILLDWRKEQSTRSYNFVVFDVHSGVRYLTLKARTNESVALWDAPSYARGCVASNLSKRSWKEMVGDCGPKILIDVRPETVRLEWPTSLEECLKIPIEEMRELVKDDARSLKLLSGSSSSSDSSEKLNIYVFCQRGISCMKGAELLNNKLQELSAAHPNVCSRVTVYGVTEGVMNH